MEEIIGSAFLMGLLGIGSTFALFVLKRIGELPTKEEVSFIRIQMAEIKKELAKLCERIGKEEVKSNIYHEKHELEDK